MSEIKISIFRDDLDNNPSYFGAQLSLPATNIEIQGAFERARISFEYHGFTVKDYDCEQDYLNELLPQKLQKASVNELNYLAKRLSRMDEFEKAAFEGIIKMEKEPDLVRLINLTYNLSECNVASGIQNDEQLGNFYVNNGFIPELEEASEKVLEYIDYEKVGRICREAEKGVYIESGYVVKSETDIKVVYDGTNIPELDDDPECFFKLCKKGCFEAEKEKGVWLKLPALESKIESALSELSASSLDECIFTNCISNIPPLDDVFSATGDIGKLNKLSNAVTKIINNNMASNYKAALEYEGCTDLDFAIDIAQNLNCYDFYPSFCSPDDYGRQVLLENSGLSPDDIAFELLDFKKYGEEKMKIDGVLSTDYGLIRRNEKEFMFEFCSKQGQQMGGI